MKRIVSILTRLIQRTETVSEVSIEYEYEYRDAEYEKKPEQNVALLPDLRPSRNGKILGSGAVNMVDMAIGQSPVNERCFAA